MNDHVGFATLISIGIVVGFTIILHEADRHPSALPMIAKPVSIVKSVTPAPPRSSVLARADVGFKSAISRQITLISTSSVSQPVPTTPAASNPSISQRPTNYEGLPPRSLVSLVQPGEQLTDVALRVYGSAREATRIWQANRDRLASVDAPVTAGWLLRTP